MINVVRAIVLSLLIGVSTPLIAQTNTGGTLPPERERAALTHWQAGQYVSNKAVEWFGINHCFVIDTISSSVSGVRLFAKAGSKTVSMLPASQHSFT